MFWSSFSKKNLKKRKEKEKERTKNIIKENEITLKTQVPLYPDGLHGAVNASQTYGANWSHSIHDSQEKNPK